MRIVVIVSLFFANVKPHNITELTVPHVADPRHGTELSCHYSMGDEVLHSIKWYRNDSEIYRYTPSEHPTSRIFNVTDINVKSDHCDLRSCKLKLSFTKGLTSKNSYSCEVSTEGPRFAVVRQSKQMTIAALPQTGPIIHGAPNSLMPGQEIVLNCTSEKSLPPAALTWFVDGLPEKADPWLPTKTEESSPDSYGLRSSWRVLRLLTKADGKAAHHIRCEANVLQDFVQSAQLVIPINSHPHISKLSAANGTIKMNEDIVIIVLMLYSIKLLGSECAFLY